MTKEIEERAVLRVNQGEMITILCEDGNNGRDVARVEVEFTNEAMEILVHTKSRCADGKCRKPVYRLKNGYGPEAKTPAKDPIDELKDLFKSEPSGEQHIVQLLESIFGKGNVTPFDPTTGQPKD